MKYDKIAKYIITARCTQPLHIGNAIGEKEEVLVHPVDDVPFIQASSIAGVFRAYYELLEKKGISKTEKSSEKLFGAMSWKENGNSVDFASQIKFSDGLFSKNVQMELRPRVSIDAKSGTCNTDVVKGTTKMAGHKFQMEYIGAGAEFEFSIYLYDVDYKEELEMIFAAIQEEGIQFGGQKSNGCGYLSLNQILYQAFDLKDAAQRKLWAEEETLPKSSYTDILKDLKKNQNIALAYEIELIGETEGELLIKSIAVTDYTKDAPDCMNIQNAQGDFIIPGSSFKGVIRNQMKKIADYLEENEISAEAILIDTFGYKGKDKDKGKSGNIRFYDTIVGEKEQNQKEELVRKRIHLDKFTGGVIHGGLFSEKNVYGKLKFKMGILDKNNPEKSCALLLLACRDLAAGVMSVGGGYHIGKGIIHAEKLKITAKNGTKAEIDFVQNQILDEQGCIQNCLQSLYQKSE